MLLVWRHKTTYSTLSTYLHLRCSCARFADGAEQHAQIEQNQPGLWDGRFADAVDQWSDDGLIDAIAS